MNLILFETCAFPCNYKVFHKGLSISTINVLVFPWRFAMCQSTLVETLFNSMLKLHSGTSTNEREHPLQYCEITIWLLTSNCLWSIAAGYNGICSAWSLTSGAVVLSILSFCLVFHFAANWPWLALRQSILFDIVVGDNLRSDLCRLMGVCAYDESLSEIY